MDVAIHLWFLSSRLIYPYFGQTTVGGLIALGLWTIYYIDSYSLVFIHFYLFCFATLWGFLVANTQLPLQSTQSSFFDVYMVIHVKRAFANEHEVPQVPASFDVDIKGESVNACVYVYIHLFMHFFVMT